MTMIILLLATLLLVFQLVISNVLKNSIYKRKYKYYILLLVLDYFFSCMFFISVKYMWATEIQKLFLLMDQLGLALFFMFYMKILNPDCNKRVIVATSIIAGGSVLNIILGSSFNPLYFILILSTVIISSYFILLPKIKEASYFLTVITSLLLFTEMVRYLMTSLVTYQFLYNNMEFLWLAIIPLVIKTLSTFLVVEVNDRLLLGNDLQKSIDYINPSNLLSSTFMEHPDAVVLTDTNLNIVFVNPRALENTGYQRDEVIGKRPKIFASGFTNPSIYLDLKATLATRLSWEGEFINKKKNGELFTEQAKIICILDTYQKPVYYLAIKSDITKEKAYLEEIERISKTDQLTGLLKRHVLEEYLNEHIVNIDVNCYFVLIDLDEFKKINDKYGHEIGDLALKFFSKVLIEEINIKSYISRFGGDEFAIGLYGINNEIFNRLFDSLVLRLKTESIPGINEEVFINMSAGAIKVRNNLTFKEIYERADKLMYDAKSIKGTNIKKNF